MVSASAAADPLDEPYTPPPFTEFPDEPDHLPPPVQVDTTSPWSASLHALRSSRVRVFAAVDAPLELAAGIELALPRWIRIGTTVGELPRSVERRINDVLVDHGVYDRSLGDLVVASMQRVVMWRGYVAVQPFARHGFLASAGVGVAWINGSATPPQVATAVGMMIPDGVPIGDSRFVIASRLHLVDAELGWEWQWQRWSVRIAIGAPTATKARTRATVQPAITDPRFTALADRAATTLDHAFITDVKTPVVSSLVGYEL
ncbi:MAG TPA: hypothetical protein VFQ65_09830 [Kofleriaceae bacterium]|nr:hypothetical protein [Kofleriaceae bacterium]